MHTFVYLYIYMYIWSYNIQYAYIYSTLHLFHPGFQFQGTWVPLEWSQSGIQRCGGRRSNLQGLHTGKQFEMTWMTTVDGRNPAKQLRLVVYPTNSRVLTDFCHQQYDWQIFILFLLTKPKLCEFMILAILKRRFTSIGVIWGRNYNSTRCVSKLLIMKNYTIPRKNHNFLEKTLGKKMKLEKIQKFLDLPWISDDKAHLRLVALHPRLLNQRFSGPVDAWHGRQVFSSW